MPCWYALYTYTILWYSTLFTYILNNKSIHCVNISRQLRHSNYFCMRPLLCARIFPLPLVAIPDILPLNLSWSKSCIERLLWVVRCKRFVKVCCNMKFWRSWCYILNIEIIFWEKLYMYLMIYKNGTVLVKITNVIPRSICIN